MIIINKKTFFITALCAVAGVSLIINGALYFALVQSTHSCQVKQVNAKVLAFRDMFTEKVLLDEKEIDFNARLSLETAVRALNDQEIFDQWELFTQSQTKEDATLQAKKLLELLIKKTSQ
ncbi:MAG: hypothetical protein NT026_02020 [Candidatus Staskawiczbacteria bacterium]|nr:hypothetical protein [Candidatus Staskawiczbacteria bacterium]